MKPRISEIVRRSLRSTPLRGAVMAYRHLGLRSTDVFLASYPRSGNTWLKSLICSSLFGTAMTDFSDTINPVIPIVGFHRNVQPLLKRNGRLIKTHESFRSEYQRAIWIVRDPRDVLVSEYRLALRTKRFQGTLDNYSNYFVKQPILTGTNWQHHAISWFSANSRERSHLLCLRFEELRTNTRQNLERILLFLDITPNDEMLDRAIEQNNIRSMAIRHSEYEKSRGDAIDARIPAVNSGDTGRWLGVLSPTALECLNRTFGETMCLLGYDATEPPNYTTANTQGAIRQPVTDPSGSTHTPE